MDRLIVTAASKSYGMSLLALLGSLTLNWPDHPPVIVYDIGLDDDTLGRLKSIGIAVTPVPEFCSHWRKHFTWKIWCLNDAPACDILWMDAGLVVLKPLDEIFDALEERGYFLVPNGLFLDREASEAACKGCGIPADFRLGKPTLAASLMGFRKAGKTSGLIQEALSVALIEENIAATDIRHRHDQAIISLLTYKYFGKPVVSDEVIYCGWSSPTQAPNQKVWVHRRCLSVTDMVYFASHIGRPGAPYIPKPPVQKRNGVLRLLHLALAAFARGPTSNWDSILRVVNRCWVRRKPAKPYDGVRDW